MAALSILRGRGLSVASTFWLIDAEADRYSELRAELLTARRREAAGHGVGSLQQHSLFEPYSLIVEGVDTVVQASDGAVILDISSFPKRFFFPIVRRLLNSPLQTLVVTYTDAGRYPDVPLSEDPETADTLPLYPARNPFNDNAPIEVLIVGLGFQPLGLPEMVEGTNTESVELLFPSPQPPANRIRVWDFVRKVTDAVGGKAKKPVFVSPVDTSEIYEYLLQLTDGGRCYASMAPFGPKPMSLAMALAGHYHNWPAYYTQPRVYHPEYALGTRLVNGVPATHAYCVRLDGRDLYAPGDNFTLSPT